MPALKRATTGGCPYNFDMNLQQSPNINYLWSSLIIEELVRSGVKYFCIAPGSRSSPLTVAVARHPKARHFIHYDERGLAFHALGYACAHREPAALICTSGTAGANFYPAIIEASKKKVPLVVLTADRPPELRATGAVQTIDQVGLFGKYVKFQSDLPCPDIKIKPEFVLTTVDQAVYHAVRGPAGVVHLNCMFRDPLAPVATGENFKAYTQGISTWTKNEEPYTTYVRAATVNLDAKAIARRIDGIRNGLIVVGKIGGESEQNAVVLLARRLGWPVFADASSGLRLGKADKNIISYFDQILASPKFIRKLNFDGILHLGGRMTSKRFYDFAAALPLKDYVMVLNHPLRNDPDHRVSLRVESSVGTFCEAVGKDIKQRKPSAALTILVDANRAADAVMEEYFAVNGTLSGPHAARLISQQIPQGAGLFLGNSLPVRDMDFFGDFKGCPVFVHGNRGASGIDGNVASAAGLSNGFDGPVTLFIGDLALLHDLNSLSMLRDLKHPVVTVVVNNDGGAIFSFLPIADSKDVFEKFFETPHDLSFHEAASMFGLSYARPSTAWEFVRVYQAALKSGKSAIIEISTSRAGHVGTYKTLQSIIAKAIDPLVGQYDFA